MVTVKLLSPIDDIFVPAVIDAPKQGWFRPYYVELIEYTNRDVFRRYYYFDKKQRFLYTNLRQQANVRIEVQYSLWFLNYNVVDYIEVPDYRVTKPPSNLTHRIMEIYHDES